MKPKTHYVWVIISVLMAAQIVGTFVTEGLTAPLAPFYRFDLGLSRAQVGGLTSAIFFGAGVLALVSGRLVDTFGVRAILSGGLLLMAVSASLFAGAQDFIGAFIAALIGGLGYSAVQPGTIKGIITWFPANRRTTMISIKQAGVPIGAAGAAVLLVTISSKCGWRMAALYSAALSLITMMFCWIFYRETESIRPISFMETNNKEKMSFRCLLAGSRDLRIMMLLCPLYTAAHYSVVAYLALFLVEHRVCGIGTAAVSLTVLQLSGVTANIGWGILGDLVEVKWHKALLMVSASIGMFGAAIFAFSSARPAMTAVWVGILLFGIGISGATGLFSTSITRLTSAANTGITVGMSMACSCIGVVFGPPLFGMVVDATTNYRWAWLLVLLYTVLTMILLSHLQFDSFYDPHGEKRIRAKYAKHYGEAVYLQDNSNQANGLLAQEQASAQNRRTGEEASWRSSNGPANLQLGR